jgi:hypothetical protein
MTTEQKKKKDQRLPSAVLESGASGPPRPVLLFFGLESDDEGRPWLGSFFPHRTEGNDHCTVAFVWWNTGVLDQRRDWRTKC